MHIYEPDIHRYQTRGQHFTVQGYRTYPVFIHTHDSQYANMSRWIEHHQNMLKGL